MQSTTNLKIRYDSLILSLVLLIQLSCNRSSDDEGEMVPLDGYSLYVKVKGKGTPAVVIENGLNCDTRSYHSLYRRVSRFTQVISYDHSGIGRSTFNDRPRTLDNYANELKTLLTQKKIPPPYILIGHSMGGFQIRYFAHLYPDEVAGLVFIDAPHEDWFSYIRSRHTSEELTYFNNFFDPSKRNLKGGDSAELSFYTAMCDSIKGKNIPSQIPVRMYTGTAVSDWAQQFGYDEKDMHVWAAMQKSILDGVVDAQQCADNDAAHYFHMDKPLVVLDGIRYLIKKSRSSVRPTPVNSKNQ